jgi:hypothetical protein
MPNHPTTTSNGPWRILVLDPDLIDRKWLIATVETPADVRPAGADAGVDEMTQQWVATETGVYRRRGRGELTPVR